MAHLSPLLKQATPVLVERGEGVHLYDEAGRRYLDFTAGIGVTSTGHCHPRVVAAAQEQVAKLIHGQYTTVMHRPLLTLAERLGEVLPANLDSVFFSNSGSEAVEAALRLARHATARPNIVVFHGSFHGRTIGAASMTTSGTKFRAGFSPIMGGVAVSPFPTAYRYGWDEATATDFALRELDYLLATVSAPAETAAFLVEPVLGEGGYVPANTAFMEGLRERADHHGILLVLDEVQTGWGRTGRFWGHDHFGVRPDILITAKGLASGFPLVRHRRVRRADGESLARIPGRHVRRQRGRLRRGDRDPRRDPGGEPRRERPRRRRRPRGRPGEGSRRQPADRRRPWPRPDARLRVRHSRRPARSRRGPACPAGVGGAGAAAADLRPVRQRGADDPAARRHRGTRRGGPHDLGALPWRRRPPAEPEPGGYPTGPVRIQAPDR